MYKSLTDSPLIATALAQLDRARNRRAQSPMTAEEAAEEAYTGDGPYMYGDVNNPRGFFRG